MTVSLSTNEAGETLGLREGINPTAKPTGTGCVDCLATGGWWLHLRRCAECGRIGCCDNSPNQHATKHSTSTGHPIITSFEHGENWFYDYRTGDFFAGPKLPGPNALPFLCISNNLTLAFASLGFVLRRKWQHGQYRPST